MQTTSTARPSRATSSVRPLVLVDVGCRWGFADRFLNCDEVVTLYGFEPDTLESERLNSKYATDNVQVFPVALAGSAGYYTLYETSDPACSSMYPPDERLSTRFPALHCMKHEQTDTALATTLEAWARSEQVAMVDYLKIDTQGSELDILHGAGALLHSISVVDLEVQFNPLYRGAALFAEVDTYMRESGFVLWNISTLVHYSSQSLRQNGGSGISVAHDNRIQTTEADRGQLFWGDARYINRCCFDAPSAQPSTREADTTARLMRLLELTDVLVEREDIASWHRAENAQ